MFVGVYLDSLAWYNGLMPTRNILSPLNLHALNLPYLLPGPVDIRHSVCLPARCRLVGGGRQRPGGLCRLLPLAGRLVLQVTAN